RRPGVERRALGIAEEAGEVVRAKQRLEAAVLRGAGQPPPALPREPFLSLDHQAHAHRHRGLRSRRFDSICARPYHTSGTRSGLNEDLGATAIYGAQLANIFPRPKYDGVLGMWYGKGPGVDRTGDIFKHANYAGIGRWGGVLALGGDDPLSKSSTLPTHSEVAFYDAFFPTLFPGNVQEILDLGRYGFEMSRYSGLWVGFKIVTNVADEI